MDLKEKIVSSYVAFEGGVNVNSDVHDIRTEAFQNFEKLGFPTKKLEAWKYTSLNSILKEDYSLFPNKEKTINLEEVKKYFIHDIDTYKKIIYVYGISQNEEERAEVINEAKQVLDVEDVVTSIFLVEDLRVIKN